MNIDRLKTASRPDLLDKARHLGIAGASGMNKDALVRAVARALKKKAKDRDKAKAAKSKSGSHPSLNGKHHANGKPHATRPLIDPRAAAKRAEPPLVPHAAGGNPPRHLPGGHTKDRIVVVVRDPYWLHVF